MGPATTVGTLPEETGTSGTAQQKHILGGGGFCTSNTVMLKISMTGI